MSWYKMLIVDDESIILDSLSSMDEWRERHIEVVNTASNGREALAIIEKQPIQIVITDIQMPDMNGLKLIEKIHEISPETRVIIISGYENFTYAHTALKYKVEGYVLKPIDTEELVSIVDDVLIKLQPSFVKSDSDLPKTNQDFVINQAIQYMESNLEKSITLKDVAEIVYLSDHYFGQLFKQVTGETFVTYLTRLRMEKACELLQDPRKKIYEVSELTGFNDSKYFSKVFYKRYEMTPNEYRLTRQK